VYFVCSDFAFALLRLCFAFAFAFTWLCKLAATRKCVSIQLICALGGRDGVGWGWVLKCWPLKWPQPVGNLAAGLAALLNFNTAVYVPAISGGFGEN